MFKTDEKSLEQLSFAFDERDIAHISTLLDMLRRFDMSTLPEEEIHRLQTGLTRITELKTEGKIYAFHVEDSYAENHSPFEYGSGVEVYERRGSTLDNRMVPATRDVVYPAYRVREQLVKQKIQRVFTGDIPIDGEFLTLKYERDPKDSYITSALEEHEIAELESAGIEVVYLEKLL